MIGDLASPDLQGIVPRAVKDIFAKASKDEKISLEVSLSAVEIYCERVRDLLDFSAGSENLNVIQVGNLRQKHRRVLGF